MRVLDNFGAMHGHGMFTLELHVVTDLITTLMTHSTPTDKEGTYVYIVNTSL